jgi:hypothetical protein
MARGRRCGGSPMLWRSCEEWLRHVTNIGKGRVHLRLVEGCDSVRSAGGKVQRPRGGHRRGGPLHELHVCAHERDPRRYPRVIRKGLALWWLRRIMARGRHRRQWNGHQQLAVHIRRHVDGLVQVIPDRLVPLLAAQGGRGDPPSVIPSEIVPLFRSATITTTTLSRLVSRLTLLVWRVGTVRGRIRCWCTKATEWSGRQGRWSNAAISDFHAGILHNGIVTAWRDNGGGSNNTWRRRVDTCSSGGSYSSSLTSRHTLCTFW